MLYILLSMWLIMEEDIAATTTTLSCDIIWQNLYATHNHHRYWQGTGGKLILYTIIPTDDDKRWQDMESSVKAENKVSVGNDGNWRRKNLIKFQNPIMEVDTIVGVESLLKFSGGLNGMHEAMLAFVSYVNLHYLFFISMLYVFVSTIHQ